MNESPGGLVPSVTIITAELVMILRVEVIEADSHIDLLQHTREVPSSREMA